MHIVPGASRAGAICMSTVLSSCRMLGAEGSHQPTLLARQDPIRSYRCGHCHCNSTNEESCLVTCSYRQVASCVLANGSAASPEEETPHLHDMEQISELRRTILRWNLETKESVALTVSQQPFLWDRATRNSRLWSTTQRAERRDAEVR